MKTALVSAIVLALLPATAVWAQERHHGNDGGGMNNNGPGWGKDTGGNYPGGKTDNSDKPAKKRSPRNRGNNAPPGNQRRLNGNRGSFNGATGNTFHHFNNRNGAHTGNPNGVHNSHFNHSNRGNNPQGHAWGRAHQLSPGLRRMGVTRLPHPMNRHNMLTADREHSTMTRPLNGPHGAALHASVIEPRGDNAVVVRSHMNTFVNNTAFSAQVNVYNNRETAANHYYWHTWNGTNYCHYYDSWGYNWYGWYWGGHCFWSRWYLGNWWWYDPVYYRWCYWRDGGWWWQDPADINVVYIYNNGRYEPAESADTGANPSSVTVDYPSEDGTRMVRITGGDAFLYDTAEGEADNKPVYLASNVKEVKFSTAGEGRPLQVLLVFDDGSFEMFDSDGNPYDNGEGTDGD